MELFLSSLCIDKACRANCSSTLQLNVSSILQSNTKSPIIAHQFATNWLPAISGHRKRSEINQFMRCIDEKAVTQSEALLTANHVQKKVHSLEEEKAAY